MVDAGFKRHDNLENGLELCGKGLSQLNSFDDPWHIFQSPYGRNFVEDPRDTRGVYYPES